MKTNATAVKFGGKIGMANEYSKAKKQEVKK